MKRNQWKIGTALLLTGLMAAASVTACGNARTADTGNKKETGTNLTMTWWGNQVRNERTKGALDKYHESNPDVTVEGQFYQWDDYWSKLATSAAGKKMPDLVQMDISYIDQYANKGQLLDLTPYMENGAIDTKNIPENILTMGTVGGGNYGIAAGVNAPALFYNKTLLEENGIAVKDHMTLDEFIATAKEVTEKTGYRANFIAHGSYMDTWGRSNGVQILEKKMGAESADAYTAYFQILKKGIDGGWHVPAEAGLDSTAIEQDPLVYGSSPETMSWCAINGSNLLSAYQTAAPEGVEIGITTVPASNPTKGNYLKPAMFFSVSADTPDPEAAVALLNYLINSDDAYDILMGERGVPASTAVAGHLFEKLSDEEKTVTSYITEVVTPNCSPLDPPQPEGSSEVRDLLIKLEEKVGYGQYTPEQAAEEYFEKGNEIYSGK